MKRLIAYSVYYLGVMLALWTIVTIAAGSSFLGFVIAAPVYGLTIWWITAGIGIRMGVTPAAFFASIARFFLDNRPAVELEPTSES